MPTRTPLILLLAAALGGCTTPATRPETTVSLAERYTTRPTPADNIDSVTTWESPTGQRWLIASAKDVDQLVVFDGDTGVELRRVGRSGTALGELDRPNGLTVIDDLLFVVERDNHRVQLFQLPDFQPLLLFGADQLKVAYGIWVRRIGAGYEAYVTDSFQLPDGTPPALDQLDHPLSDEIVALTEIYLRARFGGDLIDEERKRDFEARVKALRSVPLKKGEAVAAA